MHNCRGNLPFIIVIDSQTSFIWNGLGVGKQNIWYMAAIKIIE